MDVSHGEKIVQAVFATIVNRKDTGKMNASLLKQSQSLFFFTAPPCATVSVTSEAVKRPVRKVMEYYSAFIL